jgi:hypothetical protein
VLAARQNRLSRRMVADDSSRRLRAFSKSILEDTSKLLGRMFHYTKIRIVEFGHIQRTDDNLSWTIKQLRSIIENAGPTCWIKADSRWIVNNVIIPLVCEIIDEHNHRVALRSVCLIVGNIHQGRADAIVNFGKAILLVANATRNNLNLGMTKTFFKFWLLTIKTSRGSNWEIPCMDLHQLDSRQYFSEWFLRRMTASH